MTTSEPQVPAAPGLPATPGLPDRSELAARPDLPELPELPDLPNLRDLGGLRTGSGRRVRRGVLFRSATVSFVDDAQARVLVEDLGIRVRVDLRSALEVSQSTNPRLGAVERRVVHLPLHAGGVWEHDPTSEDPAERVSSHYLRYLEHSADSVAAFVRLLLEPEGVPALVHCTAGKDRTGVALALVLSAVGVEDAELVADYGRTRDHLEAIFGRIRALPAYEERLAALPEESFTAEPASMARFLERLQAAYGGARGYLLGAGVSEDELDRLAGVLLED